MAFSLRERFFFKIGVVPRFLSKVARHPLPENHLLGGMPKLHRLDLGKNQLTGSLPDVLGLLASMRDMSLLEAKLSGDVPDQVGCLRRLATLDMYQNKLSGSLPSSLVCLSEVGDPSALQTQRWALRLRWRFPLAMGTIPSDLLLGGGTWVRPPPRGPPPETALARFGWLGLCLRLCAP